MVEIEVQALELVVIQEEMVALVVEEVLLAEMVHNAKEVQVLLIKVLLEVLENTFQVLGKAAEAEVVLLKLGQTQILLLKLVRQEMVYLLL